MLESISDMISLAVLLLVTVLSLLTLLQILIGRRKGDQAIIHDFYQNFDDRSTADEKDMLYIDKQGGES